MALRLTPVLAAVAMATPGLAAAESGVAEGNAADSAVMAGDAAPITVIASAMTDGDAAASDVAMDDAAMDAAAQSEVTGGQAAKSGWQFSTTLYGYAAGVRSIVDTPVGSVEAELDVSEVLEDLDFAVFGVFEARKDRFALLADVQLLDFGVEGEVPVGTNFSAAEVDAQEILFSTYATYAVVDSPEVRFELGLGARYVDVDVDTLLIGAGTTPDASFSTGGGWVDGLIAARLHYQFDNRWYAVAFGDVGGFGIEDSSDLTWQAVGAVGYRLNDKLSTVIGYRNGINIDRSRTTSDIEVDVTGPFVGLQVSF